MPSTGQIIQIIVVALVFVIPALIRVIKGAQEAAARRQMEQLRQRAIEEAMRTGRPIDQAMTPPVASGHNPLPPTGAQQSAQDRLRDLAARRQAQIEALRRARAQGGSVVVAPPTGFQPGGGAVPMPVPVARPVPQRQSQPRPSQPKPSKQQSRQQTRQQRQASRQASPDAFPPPSSDIGGTAHDHDGDVTHRLVPDAPPAPAPQKSRPAPTLGLGPRVSASDLRKAIVLRELLGRPVAMREPGQDER